MLSRPSCLGVRWISGLSSIWLASPGGNAPGRCAGEWVSDRTRPGRWFRLRDRLCWPGAGHSVHGRSACAAHRRGSGAGRATAHRPRTGWPVRAARRWGRAGRQAIRRTTARRPARSPVPHDSRIGPVGAPWRCAIAPSAVAWASCPSVRCTRSCVRFPTTSGQTCSRASRRGIRRVRPHGDAAHIRATRRTFCSTAERAAEQGLDGAARPFTTCRLRTGRLWPGGRPCFGIAAPSKAALRSPWSASGRLRMPIGIRSGEDRH